MQKILKLLSLSIFCPLLFSCSGNIENSASVKIKVPVSQIEAKNVARQVGRNADDLIYTVVVSIAIGEESKSIEATGTAAQIESQTSTFNDLKVGSKVIADCSVFIDNIPEWSGNGETEISEGVNNLAIRMKSTVFTQEKFRTLMPDYKTNSDTQFAIPEGYTKLVGIDIATGRDSIFSGWAPLTSPVASYLSIKIPKSVVYIDAAAFCGITNNNLILEFEDDSGWVYTGKISQYDEAQKKNIEIDVENYYLHTGIAAFGYLKEGKGYIQKMDFLDLDFPINEKSLQVSVTDDKGDVVYISEIVSKGTILNFSVPGDNTGSDGSKPIVPKTCKWYINGELKSEKATFTWDTTEVPSGAYEVMCIVNDKFSQNLTIKIGTR